MSNPNQLTGILVPSECSEDGYEILVSGTKSNREVLGNITINAETLRKKLEELLLAVIKLRVEELKGNQRIERDLDRRIEVAVSTIVGGLHAEIGKRATRLMEERVRAAVSEIKLNVEVQILK